MTLVLVLAAHVLAVLAMPIVLVGLVNRTKSWWAGRRGPKVSQSFWDLLRLLRKQPVFSAVTTPLFRAGAWAVLASPKTGLLNTLFNRCIQGFQSCRSNFSIHLQPVGVLIGF